MSSADARTVGVDETPQNRRRKRWRSGTHLQRQRPLREHLKRTKQLKIDKERADEVVQNKPTMPTEMANDSQWQITHAMLPKIAWISPERTHEQPNPREQPNAPRHPTHWRRNNYRNKSTIRNKKYTTSVKHSEIAHRRRKFKTSRGIIFSTHNIKNTIANLTT